MRSMIFLMCSRKSPFCSFDRIEGFVVIPAGKPRASASSISTKLAESMKIFMVTPSWASVLLRDRPIVVPGVARLREEPPPVLGIEVGEGRQLPSLEVPPLPLGEERIDLQVLEPPADPFHLLDRCEAVGTLQVVDDVDRDDEVERLIGV